MANNTIPLLDFQTQTGISWTPYVLVVLVFYPILCSYLRFHRRDNVYKKYNFPTKASLARMTNVESQEIISILSNLEFPQLYEVSLQFALFKTYGIPTISSLLVATKQFSTPEHASKRYADTNVLIVEFTAHHPHDERAVKALARMNFVHLQYQKAGKISNEDLLYTLAVFVREPPRWINKYDWRTLTDVEICAIALGWKSIGDAMGIKYEGFLAHNRWTDGLDFYGDICAWSEEYEKQFMVPDQTNKQTADELVPLLLFWVPKVLQPHVAHLIGVLMGDRLRKAMIYPTPPKIYYQAAASIFSVRRFVLRYLSLPRPGFMRVRRTSDKADQNGRYFMTNYQAHPYYIKPGFWNRWGPEGWFVWFNGGDIPGSKGQKYVPQGYKLEEVGPDRLKIKDLDEWKSLQEKVKADRPAGCPMAFVR